MHISAPNDLYKVHRELVLVLIITTNNLVLAIAIDQDLGFKRLIISISDPLYISYSDMKRFLHFHLSFAHPC